MGCRMEGTKASLRFPYFKRCASAGVFLRSHTPADSSDLGHIIDMTKFTQALLVVLVAGLTAASPVQKQAKCASPSVRRSW